MGAELIVGHQRPCGARHGEDRRLPDVLWVGKNEEISNVVDVNWRKWLYFGLVRARGQELGRYYRRFLGEVENGVPADTSPRLLIQLLEHSRQQVPYYAEVMRALGDSFYDDPLAYLERMPILTKDIIRTRFEDLKSGDLPRRRWFENTSGGSTGEPVRFIQDWDYAVQSGAIKLLFSKLVGKEIGEREVCIWGSERDVIHGSQEWQARFINGLTNVTILNAYLMTPERMRESIAMLNRDRPKLIVAYAESLYELARFSEREGLAVAPQTAIISSAVTLYPFMRETIERVFGCRVFDRYGSREVGDIACERPGYEGFWVAPWGCYIEIVDGQGNRVPDGMEGEILVTLLSNLAMPLVRYRIGDMGALAPGDDQRALGQQLLRSILGKTLDVFRQRDGTLIEPGYFESMMYFRDWVRRFHVVQKSYSHIVFRIERTDADYEQAELDEITAHTRLLMGDDCQVSFKFVDDIPATGSGKHRIAICEVDSI
jgi:phenylacetate-CoA ligase